MTSTLKSTTNWVPNGNKKIPPKSEHQTRRNLRPRHIPKQDTEWEEVPEQDKPKLYRPKWSEQRKPKHS